MPPALPALLELDRATVWRDRVPVLRQVSLRVDQGQHTVILGPNGCGKSTLLKLLHRELYPLAEAGRTPLRILGQSNWNLSELRAQLGLVSVDLHAELAAQRTQTVEQTVVGAFHGSLGLPQGRSPDPNCWPRVETALAEMDIADLARRRLPTLSTGQLRRVLIARALVHRPQALLLDEPTTGLDIGARRQLLARLRSLAQSGVTLVLITHHLDEVIPETRQVVLLRDGQVQAAGSPAPLLTSAQLSALFGVPLRVQRHEHGWSMD